MRPARYRSETRGSETSAWNPADSRRKRATPDATGISNSVEGAALGVPGGTDRKLAVTGSANAVANARIAIAWRACSAPRAMFHRRSERATEVGAETAPALGFMA